MTAQSYPDGIDCVWLAADSDGHVAAFATAGSGPIPVGVLESAECAIEDIEGKIVEMPRTGSAQLLVSLKRPDDFIDIAERGIFAYDWSDVHRTQRDRTGAYEPIAVPTSPIKCSQLPPELARLVARSKLEGVTFATEKKLDVRKLISCVDVGAGE